MEVANSVPLPRIPVKVQTKFSFRKPPKVRYYKFRGNGPATMDEFTAATRKEVVQAIDSLTIADLLNLRWAARFRVRSLGRAAKGRTDEDLLMEALASSLAGTEGRGDGRRWSKNISFRLHLTGAMRSIASHWKEQFNEQEPFLESELSNVGKEEGFSELDTVASEAPGGDRCLMAREEVSLILRLFRNDLGASSVLKGWLKDLKSLEIMQESGLSSREYEAAVKRIRSHPILLALTAGRNGNLRKNNGR
jgi:hypothetical protein